MLIDDAARAAKVAKTAKAAATAANAAELVVEFRGVRYAFPPGTSEDAAKRLLWDKVVRPQVKKQEEVIELPSELPKERLDELEKPKADVVEFPRKKGPAGLVVAGTIEVDKQPKVENEDGTTSTVRSLGVNIDGLEYLLTTVHPDGRIMSNDEAVQYFKETGKHLGAFKTVEDAEAYAEKLHQSEAKKIQKLDPGIYLDEDTGKYFRIDKDGSMTELEADEAP